MKGIYEFQSKRVKLDVGGVLFTTSIETLTSVPETMLGAMFSGKYKLNPNKDGSFFIDRDGTHFRHILNFLRDPAGFESIELESSVMRELKNESKFYGLADRMFSFVDLRFSSLNDHNGVLYQMGTQGGKVPWQNPHQAGFVQVSMSVGFTGNAGTFVGKFDSPSSDQLYSQTADSWISVDLGEDVLLEVNHYSLRHGYNSNANYLHNWDLQAETIEGSWATLKTHRNDMSLMNASGNGMAKMASWPVSAKGKNYRGFRIALKGTDTRGHYFLSCAGIELYGKLRKRQNCCW